MNQIPFDDLVDRLTTEALNLFRQMAAIHLEHTGDRMFILTDTTAGTELDFFVNGFKQQFKEVDIGALDDLTDWGILRIDDAGGSTIYRVSGEG